MSLPRIEIPKSEIALSEICAEAEKLGMSYGEYVSYLEQQKAKRHKKRPARKQAKKKI